MSASEKPIELTQDEFETFVLIYAAHVDYDYSENEIDFIKSRSSEEVYQKMLQLFENHNDYSCMKIILSHKDIHFNSDTAQENLFNKLKALFEVDGDFSRIEKNFVNFFEKVTNSQSWI